MGMASITIRNLDDDVKTQVCVRAAGNGRSMEEEARLILRHAVERRNAPRNLAAAIRARIAPLGGGGLELPPRGSARRPSRLPDHGDRLVPRYGRRDAQRPGF